MDQQRSQPVAAPSVIGVTADDDRFADARRAAMRLAEREGAELILYDWDAATRLGNPLPSVWSADGTDAAVPDRLDEQALEAAGRDAIARQVGVHDIHYAMVVILAMGIGLFAPPFGVGYYAACAVGRARPDEGMRPIIGYLLALVVGLIVVAAVPWISIGFLK